MSNTAVIKQINTELVRKHLKQMREATIFQLSMATELSVVTVNSLLVQMTQDGEVREERRVPSKGGRPSMLYAYNGNYRHVLVIYSSQKDNRNLIHVLVVNLLGDCVYRKEIYIDDIQIDSFCELIDEAISNYPRIATIGFGLPGVEEGGIITGNDYENIVGDGFMDLYKSKYGLPVIFINDVNAAAKGFLHSKKPGTNQCIAAVYFPRIYPPGAGLIINGEIYTGAHHFAGEIGHLPIGIDWAMLDYTDKKAVTSAVGKLLSVYCRIVAREQFILYGDFFEAGCEADICEYTQSLLNHKYAVNVTIRSAFDHDFERGMIDVTLEQLDDTFVITKKGF